MPLGGMILRRRTDKGLVKAELQTGASKISFRRASYPTSCSTPLTTAPGFTNAAAVRDIPCWASQCALASMSTRISIIRRLDGSHCLRALRHLTELICSERDF